MLNKIRRRLLGERAVYKAMHTSGFSVFASGLAAMKYGKGEWHSAPKWLAEQGYYLTCFETPAEARAFLVHSLGSYSGFEIWECQARGLVENLPPRCSLTTLRIGRLIEAGPGWPAGTIMAKRLKLARLVA